MFVYTGRRRNKDLLLLLLLYFPRILRGRRKNEDCAERNILGWKGLVPLIEIESKNRF